MHYSFLAGREPKEIKNCLMCGCNLNADNNGCMCDGFGTGKPIHNVYGLEDSAEKSATPFGDPSEWKCAMCEGTGIVTDEHNNQWPCPQRPCA